MIEANMAWPPTALAKVAARVRESQVWWEGDVLKLDDFYRTNPNRRSFAQAGVVGKVVAACEGRGVA